MWYKYLHMDEYWHNTSLHSAIKMSLFEALYGRPSPALPDYVEGFSNMPYKDVTFPNRQEILKTLKVTWKRNQQKMADQANKSSQECTFKAENLVLLCVQHYR